MCKNEKERRIIRQIATKHWWRLTGTARGSIKIPCCKNDSPAILAKPYLAGWHYLCTFNSCDTEKKNTGSGRQQRLRRAACKSPQSLWLRRYPSRFRHSSDKPRLRKATWFNSNGYMFAWNDWRWDNRMSKSTSLYTTYTCDRNYCFPGFNCYKARSGCWRCRNFAEAV